MAQARRQTASGGPAGWVVLLGLMVLALIIAAANKGCSDDPISPAAQNPTSTVGTTTGPAAGAAALDVINQINDTIRATPVKFVTGKSDLDPTSRTVLDKVVTILQKNAKVNAEVKGHTDDEGDAEKNRELSQERAQAVVDYLVGKGIAQARLKARGLGEASPAAPNDTPANRARNRRVEFALV